MKKHYYAVRILCLVTLGVGLSVSLSPQNTGPDNGLTLSVNQAFAEDSHHYGSDGYDEEGFDHDGHDRDGYDREGYSDDGHHRDGHHDESHDHHGGHTHDSTSTGGAAQTFQAKPTVKQY